MKTLLTTLLFLLLQLCALGRDSYSGNSNTSPLSVNLGPDLFFCEGDNSVVTLSAAIPGAGYSLYSWSTGENTQDITIDLISLPVGTHEFSVSVEINTGTVTSTISNDTIVITKAAVPLVEIIDNSICSGEAVEVHFTGEEYGPVEITIYVAATGGAITIPMTSSPFFALPDIGTYTILSVSNSLCTAGQIIGNNVLIVGALCVDLGPDQVFCEGDNSEVILDAGPGFSSYLWNTGETSQSITVSLVSWGVGERDFSVTVTDGTGATGNETVSITKVGVPLILDIVDNDICLGEPVAIDFTGENYGPVTIQVLFPDGVIRPIDMHSSPYLSADPPPMIGQYTIVGVSNTLCPVGQILDHVLTVGGDPLVDIGGDIQVCSGHTASLESLIPPPADASFEWYEDGILISTDEVLIISPIVPPVPVGLTITTTYQLVVTDNLSGCSSSDEAIVYSFFCAKDPIFTSGIAAEFHENEITLNAYPNPFSNKIVLEISSAIDDYLRVDLYNLQGQQIQTIHTGMINGGETLHLNFNGSNLENGTYILQIYSEHQPVKTRTIIYEK